MPPKEAPEAMKAPLPVMKAMKAMRTEPDTAEWVMAKHPTPSVHTSANAKDKPVGESDVRPPSRAQTYVFKKEKGTQKKQKDPQKGQNEDM